jgi:hypothetical protein
MRQLLCKRCAAEKAEGTRKVFEASPYGEPAEYERVKWGRAKQPTQAQRTIYVNGAPIPMSTGEYTCDECSASIMPGERCCAWSVWTEGTSVAAWETEYIER